MRAGGTGLPTLQALCIRPLKRAGWPRSYPYNTQGSGCSSGVEHDLAKVGVEGSNPFARSKIHKQYQPFMGHPQEGQNMVFVPGYTMGTPQAPDRQPFRHWLDQRFVGRFVGRFDSSFPVRHPLPRRDRPPQ